MTPLFPAAPEPGLADFGLAYALREKLADAPPRRRKQVAREWVMAASDADLARLPARARWLLLAEMARGWSREPDRRARDRLYRHGRMDGGFAAHQAPRLAAFAAWMRGDAELAAAREKFAKGGLFGSLPVLVRAAGHMAEMLGCARPELSLCSAPVTPQIGRHGRSALLSAQDDFGAQLDQLLAVMIRCQQAQLADDFNKGRLAPDSPLLVQAALFAANLGRHGQVRPPASPLAEGDGAADFIDPGEKAFRSQPVEQHLAAARRLLAAAPATEKPSPAP